MKRVLVPIVILFGAVAAVVFMVKTRPEPQKASTPDLGALVEVTPAQRQTAALALPARGTVTAAESVTLFAEVAGRVVWTNPQLVPGGRLRKGEPLVRIDDRDYKLAVEQQKAAVERARLEIEVEQSRQALAEREWALLDKAGTPIEKPQDPQSALSLRGPQLRTARMSLASAESSLERARLALERTEIRAPFSGLVQQEQVEVGQLVGPQQPLGQLVGTDRYWVQLSVPTDWLVWLTNPDGSVKNTPATVRADVGQVVLSRDARVIRLLPDVDPVGRMARLLVEIADPLGLRRSAAEKRLPPRDSAAPTALPAGDDEGAKSPAPNEEIPLLIGTYVRVDLAAKELPAVFALPGRAVHDGDRVYVMGPDDRLVIKQVAIVHRTASQVYVSEGLAEGDRVVVSNLAAPVAGMRLRTAAPVDKAMAETAAKPQP